MSDPTEKKIIPRPETSFLKMDWQVPTLVENVKQDGDFITFQVRPGKSVRVETRHEKTYSDERPPTEEGLVFSIKPANRIGFTERAHDTALTDEVRVGDIFWQATTPTASEYRKAIGSERLIHSETVPNQNHMSDQPKFITARVFLVIP